MPKPYSDNELGKKHGKYDMERIGLFSEMPYMIGDKYENPNKNNGIRDMKKSQMYPGILKTKTGLQDAYFDQNFKRLFENEKWRPPNAGLSSTNARDKKNSTKPFVPSGGTKIHSTPGDYFGTFGPKLPAMSGVKRTLPKKVKIPANIITAPTNTRGPGYADIGLSPFPEYKPSPYDDVKKQNERKNNVKKPTPFLSAGPGAFFTKNPYFSEVIQKTYKTTFPQKNKGTPFMPPSKFVHGFNSWPTHSADRYIDPYRILTANSKNKKDKNSSEIFYPQIRNKSSYTTSIMQRKLKSAMNNNNWRKFEPLHTIK